MPVVLYSRCLSLVLRMIQRAAVSPRSPFSKLRTPRAGSVESVESYEQRHAAMGAACNLVQLPCESGLPCMHHKT